MAAEPVTVTVTVTGSTLVLTGVLGTALGPSYGPLVLMVFAALIGAMLALGATATSTRWEAVRFICVAMGISIVFTGAAMWLLETYTKFPSNVALMPVSCLLAASRNRILWVIDKVLGWGVSRITGKEETP